MAEGGSERSIGRWALTGIVINSVIGAGIFTLPKKVAAILHGGAPWAYLLCVVVLVPLGLVYAAIGARLTRDGGQYVYVFERVGRRTGLVVAALVLLVRLTSAAVVVETFINYLGVIAFPSELRTVIVFAVVLGFAVANIRGIRGGTRLSSLLTFFKLTSLALFVAAGFLLSNQRLPTSVPPATGLGDWARAVAALMFAFGGFDAALAPAGAVKSPRSSSPFAICVGLVTVAVAYFLVQLVATWSVPDLETRDRPLAAAAHAIAGGAGEAAMSFAALLSMLGWLAAAFLTVPKVINEMAKRGHFPYSRGVERISTRFGTPHVAIGIWAVLVLMLAIGRGLVWNLDLSIGARLATYSLAALALFRDKQEPASRSVKWSAGATLVLCATLFVNHVSREHMLELLALSAIAALYASFVRRAPARMS